jgi:hypothetical protein
VYIAFHERDTRAVSGLPARYCGGTYYSNEWRRDEIYRPAVCPARPGEHSRRSWGAVAPMGWQYDIPPTGVSSSTRNWAPPPITLIQNLNPEAKK